MPKASVKPAWTIEPKLHYWANGRGYDSVGEALIDKAAHAAVAAVFKQRDNIAGLGYGDVLVSVTTCMPEIIRCLEAEGWFIIPPPKALG